MQRRDDRGLRTEDRRKFRFPLSAISYQLPAIRYGMTLIELLVVTSIILLVIVMSVPIVKPLLASRKQADAARTLSLYLSVARLRAIETGKPCGVRFERHTDSNFFDPATGMQIFPNNDACILVRQVAVPENYTGATDSSRVSVSDNVVPPIKLRDFTEGSDTVIERMITVKELIFTAGESLYWNHRINSGDRIQFDKTGPYYEIYNAAMSSGGTGVTIIVSKFTKITVTTGEDPPNDRSIVTDVTEDASIRPISGDVPFAVKQAPRPTLAAPIGFPTGIVVDLEYSGVSDGFLSWNADGEAALLRGSDFQPTGPDDNNAVTIMFAPSGAVDRYYSGAPDSLVDSTVTTSSLTQDRIEYSVPYYGKIPEGPIHLLIGRWERTGSDWYDPGTGVWNRRENSRYLPDDGLRNYQDMSNYWVTINPRNGMVSTNEVAVWNYDLTKVNPDPFPSPLSKTNSRRWTFTPQVNLGDPVR